MFAKMISKVIQLENIDDCDVYLVS